MSTMRDDLDAFHHFAVERLATGESATSLDDLFMLWHDSQSRDEIHEAIQKGLADVKAGRVTPADQAMEQIRQEFGFASD